LTNHPKKKIPGLEGFGIEIVEQVPIESATANLEVGWSPLRLKTGTSKFMLLIFKPV
jgi:GTP cyclohydrolase II